jgi:2',3'-cyclic-nucleotide 2'-phosphodiesterase (5'-nucleotidase family)
VHIKLLGINDFHGALSRRTVGPRPAGGAAVLASHLESAAAAADVGAHLRLGLRSADRRSRSRDPRRGGSAPRSAATYRVTVNSFMASGGDTFLVLVQGTSRVVGVVDLDALVTYVEGLAQPFTAAIEGRIQRLN